MAALLVALAVMSLMLSMALPVWHHAAQREREAELIFRGEQYARAIIGARVEIPAKQVVKARIAKQLKDVVEA